MADFLKIAITPFEIVEEESVKIYTLLNGGFDFVHIRHPQARADEIASLLRDIPEDLRRMIKLHDFQELCDDFHVGVNVNGRCSRVPVSAAGMSKGCHSAAEINALPPERYDYVFLSPCFESISKRGYKPVFDYKIVMMEIETAIPVVALGGVTPDNLPLVRYAGFNGAAMLGCIPWTSRTEEINKFIRQI